MDDTKSSLVYLSHRVFNEVSTFQFLQTIKFTREAHAVEAWQSYRMLGTVENFSFLPWNYPLNSHFGSSLTTIYQLMLMRTRYCYIR
ncbi:hypothetical protein NTGBS_180045 [Candidatus Nitrotoga sp. BS]|uniref:hypothetical protein n=1 Tax=Candidatus Nitrotoga sp. BS TaxID=2890408 RepID=UPI001EF2598D|nr:hypothetical protein [Candidatus Nitrotoga sp. BS]CAH1194448.1 hypothetical protein NTGBS_180045 [Candidatus Nitrotoga sp. BS]